MTSPNTTHVFEYQWRRLMEGLTHREVAVEPMMVKASESAYMLHLGQWYELRKSRTGGATLVTYPTKPDEVPKEIRALALIVAA